MKISVIVPAFNEEKLIAATLKTIQVATASFSRRGWMAEIVVCDNNSTDNTAGLAKAAGAMVMFEPVNQIARARNTGAAAANGDWFIFVDADSHPTTELFEEVATQIEAGRCLAGGCTVRLNERIFAAECFIVGWNLISRICHWAAGSFIFCEKDAFQAVGGFSNDLFASEEIDLSKKLKRLARQRGKTMVILHQTSARKMHLYSRSEWLGFMRKAILQPRRTIKSRDACTPWYDGRR